MNESGTVPDMGGKVVFNIQEPHRICPVHGDVGSQTITSTIQDFEMHLCLRCYIVALQGIGVQRTTEK